MPRLPFRAIFPSFSRADRLWALAILAEMISMTACTPAASGLEAGFLQPPDSVKPRVCGDDFSTATITPLGSRPVRRQETQGFPDGDLFHAPLFNLGYKPGKSDVPLSGDGGLEEAPADAENPRGNPEEIFFRPISPSLDYGSRPELL